MQAIIIISAHDTYGFSHTALTKPERFRLNVFLCAVPKRVPVTICKGMWLVRFLNEARLLFEGRFLFEEIRTYI